MRWQGGWRRGRRWRVRIEGTIELGHTELPAKETWHQPHPNTTQLRQTRKKPIKVKFNISDDLFNARENSLFLISTTLMTTNPHSWKRSHGRLLSSPLCSVRGSCIFCSTTIFVCIPFRAQARFWRSSPDMTYGSNDAQAARGEDLNLLFRSVRSEQGQKSMRTISVTPSADFFHSR